MFGLLVALLVGCLAGWLIGWFVDLLVGWMATFLLGPQAGYAKYISIKFSNHIALVRISNYKKKKPYYSTLSGPIRASYGVFWDVIWIKLKLSARSTRLDGSQHPDIVSNGRLWRNNAEHMKQLTKQIKKKMKTNVVELFVSGLFCSGMKVTAAF